MAKFYEHVDVFCINNYITTDDYTCDGLHLTYRTKKYLCKCLSTRIEPGRTWIIFYVRQ